MKEARMFQASELGSSRDVQEPMKKSLPHTQEDTDNQLIEDIIHAKLLVLGKEAAICHECGKRIREGESVTVNVIRPPNAATYNRSNITCETHHSALLDGFEKAARELVVKGRVGWCSDQATQSSWPVLLAPRVYVVSQAGRKSGYVVPKEWQSGGKERDLGPIPTLERTNPDPTIIDTIEHCTKRRRDPGRQRPFRAAWGDSGDTDNCTDEQRGEKR
jgi:hypothetical protein